VENNKKVKEFLSLMHDDLHDQDKELENNLQNDLDELYQELDIINIKKN
jgi:hypothetical protein